MLIPRSREVHVEEQAKRFSIAVSVTIFDAVVILHYGVVIWQVWSGILWIRGALLLLVCIVAISLADIWAHACCGPRRSMRDRRVEPGISTVPRDLTGG